MPFRSHQARQMCRYVRADAWCARRPGAMFCAGRAAFDPEGEVLLARAESRVPRTLLPYRLRLMCRGSSSLVVVEDVKRSQIGAHKMAGAHTAWARGVMSAWAFRCAPSSVLKDELVPSPSPPTLLSFL